VFDFLTIGILLGLSAGCAPGPLLTLVISESLQHGVRSGVKVALAPIISDLPIILLTLYIASRLSGFHSGLGIISMIGGIFILYTGYACLRTKPVEVSIQTEPPRSLLKGVVANILNPHPYLFWISVGAPIMSRAFNTGMGALIAFLCGFYLSLVGSKILLAIAVGKSRFFLSGKLYHYTLSFLGLLLCAFAIILFRDGAKLLKLI
jgi:threonine/homoserine/homoserine lactone efflux protein